MVASNVGLSSGLRQIRSGYNVEMMLQESAKQMIEHNYGCSTPYSIGIEEEFQLVHRDSFDLVSRVDVLLEKASDDDKLQIKQELMQSVIECATKVCANTAEGRKDLGNLRKRLKQLADDSDCHIASAGTHPFSRYEFQKVTEKERYQDIISRLQWIAQRELIFGLHVHVGIDSPDKAIGVFNGIREFLPQLLALSTNSPFWQGRHTGLHSSRSKIFDSFPRSGVPQAFDNWADWECLMTRAINAGVMEDYTYVWWDVRPHPRFGTIEIRICDAQTDLDDSLALAALIQATCAWLGDKYDDGVPLRRVPRMMINENKWSAARYGLEGTFIDFENDETIPTSTAVAKLIDRVAPYADSLGSGTEFGHLQTMLTSNGSRRQLDLYGESESLTSVARMLVERTNAVQ